MRVVVCDTGPVLHLSEAGALGLLEKTGEDRLAVSSLWMSPAILAEARRALDALS